MNDLIIDGSSMFARAFFAVAHGSDNPDTLVDEAVEATLGSALSLIDAQSDRIGEPIDRMLVAWDGCNLDYVKGDRAPKPEAYADARELAIESLGLVFGAPNCVNEKYEADDVVATAVYASNADTIYVASGDKDLQQLQGGNVEFYCLNKKCLITGRHICGKWKIKKPIQLAIALAIIGDKVDGIDGIHGWGPKRVEKLFEAVSDEDDLSTSVNKIVDQIPKEFLPGFYEDFDRTLLDPDVPGVPKPAPLKLADPQVLRDLRMFDLCERYVPVYRRYEERHVRHTRVLDPDGDQEDGPTAPR